MHSRVLRELKLFPYRYAIIQLGLVGPLFQVSRTVGSEVRHNCPLFLLLHG